MKKLSKLEIVTETIAFYSENPKERRALHDYGEPVYNGRNGKHCAVGRCFIDKYKEMGRKLEHNVCLFDDVPHRYGHNSHDEMLQEQYRGHEIEFWMDLQRLHDTHDNWDASGITTEGEIAVNNMYHKFNLK